MGRLDDIVARNQKALRKGGELAGVIEDVLDPSQPPDERRRKLLAWGIVLALIAGVVLALVMLLRSDDEAPSGEIKNHKGELVELSTLWKQRRVVVTLYSGYERFPEMLREFDAKLKDFDATVIGISSDGVGRAKQVHELLGLHFDLYADPGFSVISKWGSGALDRGFAVFIVEPGGKISHRWTQDPPSAAGVAGVTQYRSH